MKKTRPSLYALNRVYGLFVRVYRVGGGSRNRVQGFRGCRVLRVWGICEGRFRMLGSRWFWGAFPGLRGGRWHVYCHLYRPYVFDPQPSGSKYPMIKYLGLGY